MKYAAIILGLALCTMMSCGSSKETVVSDNSTETRGEKGHRKGGKLDIDKVFKEMDANDDGRLAKIEVRGRLAERFDKIDADGDGYITKEEMKKAPRPQRRNRGNRGQK